MGEKQPDPIRDPSHPPSSQVPGEDSHGPDHAEAGENRWEPLSTLQIIDLIASRFPAQHPVLEDLSYLRNRIEQLEEVTEEARQTIEKLDQIVDRLRAPALRVGTLLSVIQRDRALVCINGTDYVCRIDPAIRVSSLELGSRVLCNEAFAIVSEIGFDRTGPIVRVEQPLPDGRLRIASETGSTNTFILRSSLLSKEKIKSGVEVRLDANQRVAIEVVGPSRRVERSVENVPEIPWSAVGGQDEAVQAIRDTIELPLLHENLFQRFQHRLPKGFLLYGPPGCGKTLLGKATAYNLREQIKAQTGTERSEFFLHVKGPEILNMWVGESERQVRDLFAQCRERAADGQLAFLFIDEAESILGTRRGGRSYNIASTLVPMFCTEMDGIEPLSNVIVILASNRADLIDPAILRPGRIDRKIRVRRPDRDGARRIYEIYLTADLPLAEPAADLAAAATAAHFAKTPGNEFLEVQFRSGRKEMMYRGDLASGAIIAAVVERAKSLAIKRAIADRNDGSLTRDDLLAALQLEHRENDLFPSSDLTEDWLKLTDFDPDNIVRLGPVRPRATGTSAVI